MEKECGDEVVEVEADVDAMTRRSRWVSRRGGGDGDGERVGG